MGRQDLIDDNGLPMPWATAAAISPTAAIRWDGTSPRPLPLALELWHAEARIWTETVKRVLPTSYARDAFRAIRAKTAQLNAYLAEQVQGIAVVQARSPETPMAPTS